MFFSEELLTRRKDGLGIFWLLGTLGPRTRRVSKKDIVACDLVKACETIAEPPEPMALRLSSCLLIGVARVYYQSCDHLHKDVTNFHTTLRQALISTPITGSSAPIAGLDLPAGQSARHEQITITGVTNPEWQVGLDWGFGRMDWDHLEGTAEKRKFMDDDTDQDLEEGYDDGSEMELDDDFAVVAKRSKKPRTAFQQTSATNERPRNTANEQDITLPRHLRRSFELGSDSEDEIGSREADDNYFQGEDVADCLGFEFRHDGAGSSSAPAGHGFDYPDDGVAVHMGGVDFGDDAMHYGMDINMADHNRVLQPEDDPDVAERARLDIQGGFGSYNFARFPTPAGSDRRRETSELGTETGTGTRSAYDAEHELFERPERKKRAAKKVKALQADQAIELTADALRAFKTDYAKNMDAIRSASEKKLDEKRALVRGMNLLLGPWDSLPFTAPDMVEYYLDLTTPRTRHLKRSAENFEPALMEDDEEPDSARQRQKSRERGEFNMDGDMDLGMVDTGDDYGYQEAFQDFQVPVKGGSEQPTSSHNMENEVGRRASQALSANGGHYPWDAPIEDDSFEYFAVPTSSVTRGGTRPSVATSVDVNIRLNRRLSSIAPSSARRSTSIEPQRASLRPMSAAPSRLGSDIAFEDYDELDLPDLALDQRRETQSPVMEEGLSQDIIESLDPSCRNFLAHINKRQYRISGQAVAFSELFPTTGESAVPRRVACQAFYNCLSLATKQLLDVKQPKPWREITIGIAQTV